MAKVWPKWRELAEVICDKKVLESYSTDVALWLRNTAMGVSLLEHRRNEEILEETRVEIIAMVMRRRRLEWFGHVKRRDETENIRAVVEMKMEGKRPRGRLKLWWKDIVRRDLNAWNIKEEWTNDREPPAKDEKYQSNVWQLVRVMRHP